MKTLCTQTLTRRRLGRKVWYDSDAEPLLCRHGPFPLPLRSSPHTPSLLMHSVRPNSSLLLLMLCCVRLLSDGPVRVLFLHDRDICRHIPWHRKHFQAQDDHQLSVRERCTQVRALFPTDVCTHAVDICISFSVLQAQGVGVRCAVVCIISNEVSKP